MSYLLALIPVLSIAIDRLIKHWAQTGLRDLGHSLPVIDGVFQFTYVENRGAAFGMLQGQFVLFAVLTVIVSGFLIYRLYIAKNKLHPFPAIALALLLGGALGNFYDRLVYGYVVDMFDFCLINFAVFNFADSCVVVGVILYCIWLLFLEGRARKDGGTDKMKKDALTEGEDGQDS